jgi:hypothetical protein
MALLSEPVGRAAEPALARSEVPSERFSRKQGLIIREFDLPDGSTRSASLADLAAGESDLAAAFDQSWLRSRDRPRAGAPSRTLRVGDLFCGVGGLSVGLEEAAWGVGV